MKERNKKYFQRKKHNYFFNNRKRAYDTELKRFVSFGGEPIPQLFV